MPYRLFDATVRATCLARDSDARRAPRMHMLPAPSALPPPQRLPLPLSLPDDNTASPYANVTKGRRLVGLVTIPPHHEQPRQCDILVTAGSVILATIVEHITFTLPPAARLPTFSTYNHLQHRIYSIPSSPAGHARTHCLHIPVQPSCLPTCARPLVVLSNLPPSFTDVA